MKIGVDCIGVSTSFYCHDGRGNFLFNKRSAKCRDEVGTWDCGGGKLEYGLTLEENALKEVGEEYGCTGKIETELSAITLLRKNREGQDTHWVIVPFIIRVDPSQVKNGDPEKIDEIKWFRMDDLPSPLHSGFRKTFEANKDFFVGV